MSGKIVSIAYLRGVSAILIFVCHVLFICGVFEISMWFNTGVPLFFIISAYLMSLKTIDSKIDFYIRRFKSIFPSYWIYLAVIVAACFMIGRGPDLKSIVVYSFGLSGFSSNVCVLGLGHLWFISVLLLCYLLTPLLHCLKNQYRKIKYGWLAVLMFLLTIIFFAIKLPAYSIHVASYIFIYLYYSGRNGVVTKHQVIFWCIIAIVLSTLRVFFDLIFTNMEYFIFYYYDSLFQPLARFGLAMALFTVFIYNSERIENWALRSQKIDKKISGFSNVSYEVYLTHQFILLALWEFIPYFHKGIGLIIWAVTSFIATIINSVILAKLKVCITNKLIKNNS